MTPGVHTHVAYPATAFLATMVAASAAFTTLFSAPVRAEVPVYGVLMGSSTTSYWNTVKLGLKEGAEQEQAEYYLPSIGKNQTADAKLSMCHLMLQRKPNVLLMARSDASLLTTCLEKAQELNIPVIGLGNALDQMQSENPKGFNTIVQTDFEKTVALSAEFISNALQDSDSGSVVITGSNHTLEIDSFTESLQKTSPNLNVVVVPAEELGNMAPDVRAIVAPDRTSTIAAIDSLQDNDNDVLIVSMDNQAQTPELVEAGKIHAAISQLPYLLGKKAMEAASIAMNSDNNGGDTIVYIEPVLLTKETLDADTNPMLKFIR